MKKLYIAPALRVADIETESLIANSITSIKIDANNGNAVTSTDGVWVKGDITSSNAWGDEEDW